MKLLLMNAFIPSSLSLAHSRPSSSLLKVLCLRHLTGRGLFNIKTLADLSSSLMGYSSHSEALLSE